MNSKPKGSPLSRFRQRRGLSQYALAKKVGIAQSHLRSIERGETEPRVRLAIRLAKELGVSERELFPRLDAA